MQNSNQARRRFSLGDVFLMRFDGAGSSQRGWRPGVVFQNNTGNEYSPNIVALPLTSAIKKEHMPTHVLISPESSGLRRHSMVLCENPECVPKERIGKYITTLSREHMAEVAEANILASSAISFLDPERLIALREHAIVLNSGTES